VGPRRTQTQWHDFQEVSAAAVERPKVDIAYGGSCTGGKREDFDAYHHVLL
jgi:homoaconitase/3-isopropylmalate dehydratase large subunit